jgi:hypothetical protein
MGTPFEAVDLRVTSFNSREVALAFETRDCVTPLQFRATQQTKTYHPKPQPDR